MLRCDMLFDQNVQTHGVCVRVRVRASLSLETVCLCVSVRACVRAPCTETRRRSPPGSPCSAGTAAPPSTPPGSSCWPGTASPPRRRCRRSRQAPASGGRGWGSGFFLCRLSVISLSSPSVISLCHVSVISLNHIVLSLGPVSLSPSLLFPPLSPSVPPALSLCPVVTIGRGRVNAPV